MMRLWKKKDIADRYMAIGVLITFGLECVWMIIRLSLINLF